MRTRGLHYRRLKFELLAQDPWQHAGAHERRKWNVEGLIEKGNRRFSSSLRRDNEGDRARLFNELRFLPGCPGATGILHPRAQNLKEDWLDVMVTSIQLYPEPTTSSGCLQSTMISLTARPTLSISAFKDFSSACALYKTVLFPLSRSAIERKLTFAGLQLACHVQYSCT